MPTVTATIRFVNPPKSIKGPHSIRIDPAAPEGTEFMKIWPRDLDPGTLKPGGVYDLDYDAGEYQGKPDLTLKVARVHGEKSNGMKSAPGKPEGPVRADTSRQEHENMLVRGGVCAAIEKGAVDVFDPSSVEAAITSIKEGLRRATNPQHAEDMNDGIGF